MLLISDDSRGGCLCSGAWVLLCRTACTNRLTPCSPPPLRLPPQVRKGDSIGQFLRAVRDQLAPEFRELRALGTDGLMYIKVRWGALIELWWGWG